MANSNLPPEKKQEQSLSDEMAASLMANQQKHPQPTFSEIHPEEITDIPKPTPKPKFKPKHALKLGIQFIFIAATIVSLAVPGLNVAVATCAVVGAFSVGLFAWKNRYFNPSWRPWNSQPFYRKGKQPHSMQRRMLKNIGITLGAITAIVATVALVAFPPVAGAIAIAMAVIGLGVVAATLVDAAYKYFKSEPHPTPTQNKKEIAKEQIENAEKNEEIEQENLQHDLLENVHLTLDNPGLSANEPSAPMVNQINPELNPELMPEPKPEPTPEPRPEPIPELELQPKEKNDPIIDSELEILQQLTQGDAKELQRIKHHIPVDLPEEKLPGEEDSAIKPKPTPKEEEKEDDDDAEGDGEGEGEGDGDGDGDGENHFSPTDRM